VASEKILERKKKEVEQLSDIFSRSGVYLFDYRGLSVSKMEALRRKARTLDAEVKVLKNRLAIKYFQKEKNMEYGRTLFSGPLAVAYADKTFIDVAKLMIDSEKDFEPLKLKGGFIEGILVDKEKIRQVAKLPPKEQLMAQLAMTMVTPLKKFGMSLSAPLTNMLILMKNLKDKKEKEENQ